MLPASQWDSTLQTQCFVHFRKVLYSHSFDCWVFTICFDISFMYLLCQFSVIFHDASWLSSSSYLNRLTLYPGKASQTCISHHWFRLLWGQFLSLLCRMHILFLIWLFLGTILMFTYPGSLFICLLSYFLFALLIHSVHVLNYWNHKTTTFKIYLHILSGICTCIWNVLLLVCHTICTHISW